MTEHVALEDLRTVRTVWRSFMDIVINTFFIGVASLATWGTWTFGLVVACVVFRITFLGYITPRQHVIAEVVKAERLLEILAKIAKDTDNKEE